MYIRVSPKKMTILCGQMMGELGNYKMILLLLFSIFERAMLKPKLQILRCAHAQKQMGGIYYNNAAENYKKKIADVLVGSKYGK